MSVFDKKLIKQDFERAAKTYNDCGMLQWQVAGELVKRGDDVINGTVLDVGCGTGYIQQLSDWQNVIQLDLAYAMCERAQEFSPVVNADMEQLPIADGSVDSVVSSLALQWATNPRTVLAEAARVLKPKGYALYATFGPETLNELKQLFKVVDGSEHVSPFLPDSIFKKLLEEQDFEVISIETDVMTLYYESVRALLKSIRGVGASNKRADRHQLLTREALEELQKAYHDAYSSAKGISATWEVIYILARKKV